ncbi:MAG: prolyl oligopeptidase family serine peptidase, partial [Sulfolobales archaeon]
MYTRYCSSDSRDKVLLIGAEDYFTLYVNNERIFTSHVARRYEDSFYAVPVRFREGSNDILIKISRLAGRWGLSAKILTPNKPYYINYNRIVKPRPLESGVVKEWIGIPILFLRDVKSLKVICDENDFWDRCFYENKDLKRYEIYQIPLRIVSKRPLRENTYLQIKIILDGEEFAENILIELSRDRNTVHTYRSLYDGSVHRYGVKIPLNYNPELSYPVVLLLHGFKGIQMYSEIYGDKDWIIAVGITARDGEVPYREIGLLEILEVIRDLESRYRIDLDRIYIEGHSMGGYGAWYAGVTYPDVFAAVVPLSSRGDLSDLVNRIIEKPSLKGLAKLYDMYNPARYLVNLRNTSIFISHGSEDDIVSVEYSRKMSEKLKRLGIDHVYEEVYGRKHWWGSYSRETYYGAEAVDRYSIERFLKSSKRRIPKRITIALDSIRNNRFWWLNIDKISYKDQAYIDIEIEND